MDNLTINLNRRKENINSFLIAFFLQINMLSLLFEKINGIIGILAIVIIIVFFFNNGISKQINVVKTLIYVFILTSFLISFYVYKVNQYNLRYFLFFIMFASLGFILSESKFDKVLVYKLMIILATPVIIKLIITKAYIVDYSKRDFYGYLMGITYAILPAYIASILLILESSIVKDKKKTRWLNRFVFVAISYIYIKSASRGAILAVIIFIFGMKIFVNKKMSIANIIKKLLLFLAICVIIIFSRDILTNGQYLLKQVNIEFDALNKTIRLLNDSNVGVGNGRLEIWTTALKDTLYSPLWGSGIASYENKYYTGYVHNIFIQIIYEFGYISFFCMSIVVFLRIKKINKGDEKIFIWFLFCIGIVELLLSSVFWLSPRFWFFIGFIFTKVKVWGKCGTNSNINRIRQEEAIPK